MVCESCGEKPKNMSKDFTKAVIEINNPEEIVLFRKVVIPASMGDDTEVPAAIGKYRNVLLVYEANNHAYLYSSDGIPTLLTSEVAQELEEEIDAVAQNLNQEIDDRKDADIILQQNIDTKVSLSDLATVATTGQYSDLSGTPSLATVATTGQYSDLIGTPSLATVATTGSYTDLTNKPTIPAAQVQSDWTQATTSAVDYIKNKPTLATVATSGSYNDLSNTPVIPDAQVQSDWGEADNTKVDYIKNKPTIGDATLTIKRNNTSAGTFTANATSNKSINITVPTKTSELINDGSDATTTYVEADQLATVATSGSYSDLLNKPTIDTSLSTSSSNATTNSSISTALNNTVLTDIDVNATPSTTTVQLDGSKKNLYSGTTSTKNVVLPVASTTQAGVMNSSTFDAVVANTNNLNAIMNGAVAITGLSPSASQSDLTTAWQNETGLTTLINRASIYDVTNDKVWTYYTNDTTWHAASNTTQITVNTFTNSSEGTIKGSTNTGQVFAENDGTGSVNGWDTLSNNVSTNAGNISSLQTAVAGKQNALTAGSNISISGDTISATDTTYSAGTGLSLTGTTFAVNTSTIAQKSDIPTQTSELTNNGSDGTSTYVEADDLATVATSGSYADLLNKPTIPTVNNAQLTIQKNGTTVKTFTANASSNVTANIIVPTKTSDLSNDSGFITGVAWGDVTGKPSFATVATSGSYADLTNKPTIPAAQVNSDWNANSGVAQILNKPSLATVATSGSYADLSNKPTIPTVNDATLTIQQNGTDVATFTANSSTNATANITSPVITMTDTDPGEGSALAANNFVGVYGTDPIILDYSTSEINTGAKWIDGTTIYKKTVNTGALPNASSKSVAHNIANLSRVIRVEGYAYDSSSQRTYPIPYASWTAAINSIGVYANDTYIVLGAGIDRSGIAESYVTLYYTKTS